jgi:ribosomal protein S18 acetylase RimI-like enzyme
MPRPKSPSSSARKKSSADVNGVVVRRAIADDADALSLVAAATFLESYAHMIRAADMLKHVGRHHIADTYRAFAADPACGLWIAELGEGGAPIGYALLTPPDLPIEGMTPQDCELRRIYILSRHQKGGVGRRLMEALTDHARETGKTRLFVGVHSGNDGAIGFYRRSGFVDAGRRIFRVGDTDYDDLIFAMDIAAA